MARLLVLGGSPFQAPAILHALKQGHYVITCDYLPRNPGHRFAHEYHNVSTTDAAAVLALAQRVSADGVLAFASDPAAMTAAYVTDALKLPGCPPRAVDVLADKGKFRAFLRAHGFFAPDFRIVSNDADAAAVAELGFPLMIKPVDSSGSKGVCRVEGAAHLEGAVRLARAFSRCGNVIAEQWVERQGRQIAGDGIVVDGQLRFICPADEHFDLECSPYAPVGESFPGSLDLTRQAIVQTELERLFSLLGIRNLVFNLDACFDRNEKLLLIEVGPRAGGNCLPTMIQNHTGVNSMEIAIRFALGQSVDDAALVSRPRGFHASWMIHSRTQGRLSGLRVAPELSDSLVEFDFFRPFGSPVDAFRSSKDTLGYALFDFTSADDMESKMAKMATLLEPIVA